MTRRTGFTLIEVMIAMAVLTVVAGGLIGMQAMTSRSNRISREMTIATEIAQTWAERMKLDAMTWNNNVATTVWLTESGAMGAWLTPATALLAPPPIRSFAFDRYGRDVDPAGGDVFYCVAYNFNWVVVNESMRIDIRVYWPREGTATAPTCNQAAIGQPENFRSVGLPVVVKRTVLPT